ncbi:TonB-dependent receptor [Granulicella tundricola]|uniref:TonB-dependent receptor plug n=1 Tax=Granulicella tundricola (strain ATCC BAA-1859 / DSM 23138 / MP5ACTX9) TaxID=1198114 RepID=E8X5X3_GRATM|nr:TonB-dependent receptor [Granulicella tundricola]ADW70857.1 TonB-dependent receptor plug [Granulicella tundricola MP5ACTX9]
MRFFETGKTGPILGLTRDGGCGWKTGLAALTMPMLLTLGSAAGMAQTGGQGALEGSVLDQTGAVVPKAMVTATNQASGVSASATSSGAGLYSITPLIPGVYTVTVKAEGFQILSQKNIEVNGLTITGLNPKLNVGNTTETITVSEAPPVLQTTNPAIEAIITQDTYESLPIIMNNQQRDPTSLATLAPGAQGGARTPIFSGTGNYLAEVYVDGVPTTTTNQQGDNRIVSNGIPVESVEQLQIISAAPSAEYQGAGAIGFTIKSGTKQYHGQVVDFIRNTVFDTWGFAGNQQTYNTVVNGASVAVPTGKPVEHQNELSASIGGPIIGTHGKGFFFANYDQFHGRVGVTPTTFTIPTLLMRQGNFSELGTGNYIYNPLATVCSTTSSCQRPAFANNTIPTAYQSPISLYEQKFLPTPNVTGNGIVNNFQQGGVSGFDNHEYVFKLDYDLPHTQRLSYFYAHGVRQSAGYGAVLPLPYATAISSNISPTTMVLEHSIGINSRMVNQIKVGFTRFPGGSNSTTFNQHPYEAGPDVGITGLPAGQAAFSFPGSTFTATGLFTNAETPWSATGGSFSSTVQTPNAYTLIDNFQLNAGKHSMTFGVQYQRLEDNLTSQTSPSGIYYQTWNGVSTAQFIQAANGTYGNTLDNTKSGFAYASFLLGAVNTAATSVPLVAETGGRYAPVSPYFQDDWKIRPNLTINLGVRYDYLTPFHEVHDNYSFFNPNEINPATGNAGLLEYAGFRGSNISCECHTPIPTYLGNIGPRLGLEYSPDPNTVFRAGFAIVHSRGGGVGGRAGDSVGTGQTGFGSSIILPTANNVGATAGPSFYLNNSSVFQAAGLSNTNFGGPGYAIPPSVGPSVANLTVGTGNYVNASGAYVTPGGAPGYADPYLSSRAPTFNFWNLGLQKVLTKNLTLTVTYVGSQSHFVAGAGVSGFWSGQLDPRYIATLGGVLASDGKTNILAAQATPANIAIAQKADPSVTVPYAGYAQAGAVSSAATIGRMLRPYPQYTSPPSATYDNVANLSYNAFEVVLAQRQYKGMSFTVNYTYSHNIGDDGTTRSAFAIPSSVSSNGSPIAGNNRADRSLVITDTPQNLNMYGVLKSPFGKNGIGGDSLLVRALAGGWQLADIFTYNSGTPILIVGSGCTAPSQGNCMPDIVPGKENSIRANGGYGAPGVTYGNYNTTHYLDPNAFQALSTFGVGATPTTKIGDAPRSISSLRAPSKYNDDAAIQRSFNLSRERVKFIFRADCFDVSNKVTFSIPQTQTVSAVSNGANTGPGFASTVNNTGSISRTNAGNTAASFGEFTSFSGNRRFQFSGRVTF